MKINLRHTVISSRVVLTGMTVVAWSTHNDDRSWMMVTQVVRIELFGNLQYCFAKVSYITFLQNFYAAEKFTSPLLLDVYHHHHHHQSKPASFINALTLPTHFVRR